MENKNIELKLTKQEIETIQLALAEYIFEKRKSKYAKDYVEKAKILLDNINFYKRQKNEE